MIEDQRVNTYIKYKIYWMYVTQLWQHIPKVATYHHFFKFKLIVTFFLSN